MPDEHQAREGPERSGPQDAPAGPEALAQQLRDEVGAACEHVREAWLAYRRRAPDPEFPPI